MKKGKKVRLTEAQIEQIGRLTYAGKSSREIQRHFEDTNGRAPSHVTISRWAKKFLPLDGKVVPWEKGLWPEEATEVAYLFRLMEINDRRELYNALDWRAARWALRLRLALCPGESDNALATQLFFAHSYAWREREALVLEKSLDTADLDAFVMARPWESKERLTFYHQAVKEGEIPAWSVERELAAMETVRPGAGASYYKCEAIIKQEEASHERSSGAEGKGDLEHSSGAGQGPGHAQAPTTVADSHRDKKRGREKAGRTAPQL